MSSISITILTQKIDHVCIQIVLMLSTYFQITRLSPIFLDLKIVLEDSHMILSGPRAFVRTSWDSARTRRKDRYTKLDG